MTHRFRQNLYTQYLVGFNSAILDSIDLLHALRLCLSFWQGQSVKFPISRSQRSGLTMYVSKTTDQNLQERERETERGILFIKLYTGQDNQHQVL